MVIPPIKSSNHNSVANERISAFNKKLEIYANSANNMNLKLLPIHQMMMKPPHYNYLFYDDLHFNYQQGVPFLKNDFRTLSSHIKQYYCKRPILFNIYVNDLHRAIDNDNCQVIQYADDTFLYSSHTNEILKNYVITSNHIN